MKYSIAAVAAFAAAAFAQDATPGLISPAPGNAPEGCVPSYSGSFGILNTLLPGASDNSKRTPPSEGTGYALYLNLNNGILYDSHDPPRFGYIASNEQLQFDNPIQAGGKYDMGWSLCPNMTLALGQTTVFYQCQSGDFYNFYFAPVGANCIPIELTIQPGDAPSTTAVTSAYVAPTTSVPVYTASSYSAPVYSTSSPVVTSVASSSSKAAASSSAAAASSSSAAASTTAVAASSKTASASSSVFSGAAPTMAAGGSFFAVAAGAVAVAMF